MMMFLRIYFHTIYTILTLYIKLSDISTPTFVEGGGGDRDVTVQTVPCTLLHGIRANEVMVSGHLVSALFRSVLNMRYRRIAPLAEGDP